MALGPIETDGKPSNSSPPPKVEVKQASFASRVYQSLRNNWLANALYSIAKSMGLFSSQSTANDEKILENRSVTQITGSKSPGELATSKEELPTSKKVRFSQSNVIHKYPRESGDEDILGLRDLFSEQADPEVVSQARSTAQSSSSLIKEDEKKEQELDSGSVDVNSSMYASWMGNSPDKKNVEKVIENNKLLETVSPDFKQYNKVLEEIHNNAELAALQNEFVDLGAPLSMSFVYVQDEVAEGLAPFFSKQNWDEENKVKDIFKKMFIFHPDRRDPEKLVPDALNEDIEIQISNNETILVKDQFHKDSDRFGLLTFNDERLFEMKVKTETKETICENLRNKINDDTVFNRLGVLMHQSMAVDFLEDIFNYRMNNNLMFFEDVNSPWNQLAIQGAPIEYTVDENTGKQTRIGGQEIAIEISPEKNVSINIVMPYRLARINADGDIVIKGYACINRRLTFPLSDLQQDWGSNPTTTENILPHLQVYQRVTSINRTLAGALVELEKPFGEIDPQKIEVSY